MFPACIASVALVAAKVAAVGGITAFAVKKLRSFTPKTQAVESHSTESGEVA